LCKNLVDLHGGTFALRSKLREGTEVVVTFPPERVMSALEPIRGPTPKKSADIDGMNLSAKDAGAPPPDVPRRRMTVALKAVLPSDFAYRQRTRLIALAAWGREVTVAPNILVDGPNLFVRLLCTGRDFH
jgi:hypothetical protein